MNHHLLIVLLMLTVCNSFAGDKTYNYKGITISIPEAWSGNSSVLSDENGNKVAEVVSKKSWRLKNGDEFISYMKSSCAEDPCPVYIKSGSIDEIYYICQLVEYTDGKRGYGNWWPRTFWVNGTILTVYSLKSCDDNFSEALRIAKTLNE